MRFVVYLSGLRITYCVARYVINSRAHARAVRSGTATSTTGVRVLPEASFFRVPLGAAAAAAAAADDDDDDDAGCSCDRDRFPTPCSCLSLVLVAIEQSSDLVVPCLVFAV